MGGEWKRQTGIWNGLLVTAGEQHKAENRKNPIRRKGRFFSLRIAKLQSGFSWSHCSNLLWYWRLKTDNLPSGREHSTQTAALQWDSCVPQNNKTYLQWRLDALVVVCAALYNEILNPAAIFHLPNITFWNEQQEPPECNLLNTLIILYY